MMNGIEFSFNFWGITNQKHRQTTFERIMTGLANKIGSAS